MIILQQYAQKIVDDMQTTIPYELYITDTDGSIVAATRRTACGKPHRAALLVIEQGLDSLLIEPDGPFFELPSGILLPLQLRGQTVGVIGIIGAVEQVRALGSLAKKAAEVMLGSLHSVEKDDQLRTAKNLFLESLLFSENPSWSELEVRGQLLGFNLAQPYTVAIFRRAESPSGGQPAFHLEDLESALLRQMVNNHLSAGDSFIVSRDQIVLLLCRAERNALSIKAYRICQDIEAYYALHLSCGVSSPTTQPMDIRRCYAEAQTASKIAAYIAKGRVVFYDEASLDFAVQSIPREISRNIQDMVFSGCSKVERQEFSTLIRIFFDYDGDLKRCAQQLIIHRNTFQYRIEQLRKKTGYDLQKPKDAILLYIAMQAAAIDTP